MVDFIGMADIERLVQRQGVGRFIERLADAIEADYRRWSEFDKQARVASHSEVGVIELMPASDGQQYAFKYVNGHPKNTAEGLLTVTAFGVLADVDTGYPVLLSELTVTTALRTAAMSALAAKHLARPGTRVMALIGNGAQSEFPAKLERNLRALPELADLVIVRCASTAEAVRGADIVTTVTADKKRAVILTPEMIEPGMHLNAVGGDCPGKTELHADILARADARVIVEYEPQSRIEGEIQQMPADFAVTEFADVVLGKAVGRRDASEVTVFDSVGFALEDFSALRFLHRLLAEERGARSTIDLLPELSDPKDLFGGTLTRKPLRRAA
jgi:ornithine cyclodeaminase